MAFIPHTKADIQAMLETIGVDSIEQLFDEIPLHLVSQPFDGNIIPEALTENEAFREFKQLAAKDKAGMCFIGAGAYEHHIPAAVWELTSRGEFLTAYTPYQPEASQGTLQTIYEYQTMIASLTGLDVSNASLYDGASALAEAILMAVRANRASKSQTILMPKTLHPFYRETARTIVSQLGIQLVEVNYDKASGKITPDMLKPFEGQDITALVIPQPNFFGALEDVDMLTDWAHSHQSLAIGVINPIAAAVLKEPGAWGQKGADIACGEGQPLGVPLASGGPYFGFMACREAFVRQMPGRIVGQTLDLEGRPGFVLTLQAREQHIRRSKATSNICTNQGLLMTAATIFMSLLGPQGMQQVAAQCHQSTMKLIKQLKAISGVKILFNEQRFHEFVLQLPVSVEQVLKKMALRGIQAGFSLKTHYPELGEALLVCVTETKSETDLFCYAKALNDVLEECTASKNIIEGSLS